MKNVFLVLVLAVAGLLLTYWLNSSNELRAKNEPLEMSKIGSFVVVDKVINGNHCRVVLADPMSDSRFVVSPEDYNLCVTLMPRDGVTVVFKDIASYGLTNKNAGSWLVVKRLVM